MRCTLLIVLAGCGRISFDARTGSDGGDVTSDAPCMPSAAADAFQPRSSMTVDPGAYTIVVADLNGDGHGDLIAPSNANFNVQFFRGAGRLGFGAKQTFATGANPFGVTTGDLDGDGHLDVVTANAGDNTISVLYGSGDLSTLLPKTDYSTHAGPRIPAIAQVAAGAPLDIIVNAGLDATFGIFSGNANRTFGAVQPYFAGSHPYGVAVGDFDHNGFIDIVTPDITDNAVEVFFATGLDAFASVPVKYMTAASPQAVAVADLDRDGSLDIIAADTGGNVHTYINNGSGTFTERSNLAAGANPVAVIAADLTGDGVLDVATANQGENNVGLLAGNGDGSLQPAAKIGTGQGPYSLAAWDLDEDGRNDLVTSDVADGVLGIMLGTCVR